VGDDETPALVVPTAVFAEGTSRDGTMVKYDVSATNVKGSPADVRCDPTSGKFLPLGVTPVICTAYGPNGKTISEGFNITVGDTTPPDLSLPRDFTVQAPRPEGEYVTYSASAKDTIDGATLVTCFPESGSLFASGTTTVNCSSSDNARNTSTGTFVVTVLPWFDPVEP
jgi:hypothetical protein